MSSSQPSASTNAQSAASVSSVRTGLPPEKVAAHAALTTALLAAMAAIASLLMARHSGKATSELVKASNYWNYYQAKSLKSYILLSESELLAALGKEPKAADAQKLQELEKEKKEIKATAEQSTAESERNSRLSHWLGDAVTLFQIAIANSAIAALVRRRPFWWTSVGFGAGGVLFFVQYVLAS